MQPRATPGLIACTAVLIGLAALPAGAVAQVPDGCPDIDSLPRGAIVTPAGYADVPVEQMNDHPFIFTDRDEVIYASGLENWHSIEAVGGDDTIFIDDPGNATFFMGGPGSDLIILCEMTAYDTRIGTDEDLTIAPEGADTVIIEAAAFDGIAPGFTRRIDVGPFVPGSDTLILRVPPSLEVTERPMVHDGSRLFVGDTVITVFMPLPEKGDAEGARRLLGSDGVIVERVPEPAPAARVETADRQAIPDRCPAIDRPPAGALVVMPASPTYGHAVAEEFTLSDDTVLIQGLELSADTRAGDDALFLYEPEDHFFAIAGPGRDVIALCSMSGLTGTLLTSDGTGAPEDDADVVLIEPSVFEDVPANARRVIFVDGFVVGIDTLVLRIPASMEATMQALPATADRFGQTKIAVGNTLVVVSHPLQPRGTAPDPSPPLPGSGSLIIEPVS